jgi:prevent-host-death family protein
LTSIPGELYSSVQWSEEFMAGSAARKTRVISALDARANFGKLLNQLEQESESVVIEKRGTPRAVLLSLRDYVKMAAPEPEILRLIGEESRRKGTDRLSTRQIDEAIKATRNQKTR